MSDEHVCNIGQDFLDDAWSTSCSCGWEGPERLTRDDALEDWDNHVDVVFMEATMHGDLGE